MSIKELRKRNAPLEMTPKDFKKFGYQVVDQLADFLETLPQRPVTTGETPSEIRKFLSQESIPEEGTPAENLIEETIELLVNHSLFNGHPRFWGYITSSAAPIGALGDFIAAMLNPNVGAWIGAPIGSAIEAQTIQWIGEMIGYPSDCGGLLVSGGNVANFVGFMAARQAKAPWDIRTQGFNPEHGKELVMYCSEETHTWIEKAVDQYGIGTDAIRWITTNDNLQMDVAVLREHILADKKGGRKPFLVVGTAGSTGVGVIDPIPELTDICREFDLWLHIDAAYGGFAACLPDASPNLKGIREADSVALDPHKWLYAPLEAGCVLVRDPQKLKDAFSHHPPSYYKFDEDPSESPINYYEYGPQNSRGFRALKVWLAIRQVGSSGYRRMISEDIQLARTLFDLAESHPELEAFTNNLSITTFRYIPHDLEKGGSQVESYLNQLNSELVNRLQHGGEAFLSNAVIKGTFVLRACIVNFRTSLVDIEALPEIVIRVGKEVDAEIRPETLKVK